MCFIETGHLLSMETQEATAVDLHEVQTSHSPNAVTVTLAVESVMLSRDVP